MGKLYVVGTPIGNLEDITLRALRILREVDLIAAEDTRRTRKLLAHYEIHTKLFGYRRENEVPAARKLAGRIADGIDVALVTDAGTPGLSDPGFALVAECVSRSLDIEVVPGPSSLTALLSVSAVPITSLLFDGYLPSKKSARRARLLEMTAERRPVVFLEAPHRIRATLEDIAELLPARHLVLGRELTKLHEEIERGSAAELLENMGDAEARGEYIGLLAGARESDRESTTPDQLAQEVQTLLDKGVARNDAFKMTALNWGVSRKSVYEAFLRHHQKH